MIVEFVSSSIISIIALGRFYGFDGYCYNV